MLSDAQWKRIEPLCADQEGDVGRTGDDNRRFVEAVLWLRTDGGTMARPAAAFWQVEHDVPAVEDESELRDRPIDARSSRPRRERAEDEFATAYLMSSKWAAKYLEHGGKRHFCSLVDKYRATPMALRLMELDLIN